MTETTRCDICRAKVDAYLCTEHYSELGDWLDALPELFRELIVTLTKQSKTSTATGAKRTKGFAQPLPFNASASEALSDAQNILKRWADHLVGDSADSISQLGTTAATSHWLSEHRADIRLNQSAGEIFHDIRNLVISINRTIDRREERHFAGPCYTKLATGTYCQADLYIKHGAKSIKCDTPLPAWIDTSGVYHQAIPACGAEHSLEERDQFLLDAMRDQSFTLDMLKPWLPRLLNIEWPPQPTIRTWRNRKRLVANGTDRDGNELYPVADVINLLLSRDVKVAA